MPQTLYTNAHLICPASGLDAPGATLVHDGKIVTVGANIERPDGADIVDCGGKTLVPGFIDMPGIGPQFGD